MLIHVDICKKACIKQPNDVVFITLGRLVAAYLIIGEILGVKDVKGELVFKSVKGVENMVGFATKTSLKDVVAMYAYSLGAAMSSLLQSVIKKFADLRSATESNIVRLRNVKVIEEKKALSTIFPEDLIDILKIRLNIKDDFNPCLSYEEGTAVFDILSRVQYLMESSKISVENARSAIFDTQSKFLLAAFKIVKDMGSDTFERQLALELLCLHYERNFINEMLKDSNTNNPASVGMVFGLFNKCLPNIIEAINALVKKAEANQLKDLKVGNVLSGRAKLLIAIYILGADTVASIVFSNLVRISGSSGGAEEMELINNISEAIFIYMKHVKKVSHKLPKAVKAI